MQLLLDLRCPLLHLPPLQVSIGSGPGRGMAWGCDLSYDYVKVGVVWLCCAVLCCGSRVSRQLEHTLAALRPVLFADAACPACIDAATNITCLPPCPADQCRVHNVTAHSCEPGCPPCQQRPAPKQWATYESCSEQSFAPTCVNLSGPLRERSWRHCAHSSRFRFHHGINPTPMASRRHRAHPAAAQLQVLARTEIAQNTQRTAIQALSCKAKRLQAPYLGRTAPPRRRHRPAADLDLLQQNAGCRSTG